MNSEKKEFYNPEKEITETYEKKQIVEKAKVKDINDLIVIHYYWQDADGELWNDFDDPMENVRTDFNAYRTRLGFMQPLEIKKLRKKLKMTVREFGDWTGLGYGNISKIENNQRVQTKYQDRIFKLTKDKLNATGNILDNKFEKLSVADILNERLDTYDDFNPNLLLDNNCYPSTYSIKDNLGDAA